MDISWAPRSSRLAFSTAEKGIFVIDAQTCAVQQVTHARFHFTPDWSPDERQIVLRSHTCAGVTKRPPDLRSRRGEARVLTHGSLDQFPSWSPRGDRIAFSRRADILRHTARRPRTSASHRQRLQRRTRLVARRKHDCLGLRRCPLARWMPTEPRASFVQALDRRCVRGPGLVTRRTLDRIRRHRFVRTTCLPHDRLCAGRACSNVSPPLTASSRDKGPTWSPQRRPDRFRWRRRDLENLYVVRPDGSGVRALTESS